MRNSKLISLEDVEYGTCTVSDFFRNILFSTDNEK